MTEFEFSSQPAALKKAANKRMKTGAAKPKTTGRENKKEDDKMAGDERKELNLKELEQATGGAGSRPSGMPCPQCGGFITVSMGQITTQDSLLCPNCGLKLNINQQESRPAIEALKKFQKKTD